MRKAILFTLALGLFLLAGLALTSASHATYDLSSSLTFREDISGENRGFTLTQTTPVSRLTTHGYYNWRQHPTNLAYYPHHADHTLSQNTINQAFRTFQQDSRDQSRLEEQHLRYHHRGYRYGGYYGYYRGYSPYYYRYGF